MGKVIGLLLLALVLYILWCVYKVWATSHALGSLTGKTVPFARLTDSDFRILVLGDSTAYGTGAESPEVSTAGWFGQKFPKARVENFSQNGLKAEELLQSFDEWPAGEFDLIVLQIGANDVVQRTGWESLEKTLAQLLPKLETKAKTVIWFSSGNIGAAPMFSWPFDRIYESRAKYSNTFFAKIAQKYEHVHYVKLFDERSDDPFVLEPDKHFAPDNFHPNKYGYGVWLEKVEKVVDKLFS